MQDRTYRIFLNASCHLIKHLVSDHLVLNLWISLAISLKTDSLTQLIHIINMIHPFCVDHFQENDTLNLTHMLRLRKF